MSNLIKEQQAALSDVFEILKAIWASPIVKAIIATLLAILKKEAEDLLPKVVAEVNAVNALPLSGSEKMQKVLADLKAVFPGVAENTLRSFIELAVMNLIHSGTSTDIPTMPDTPAPSA